MALVAVPVDHPAKLKSFFLDRTEVSVLAYRGCVRAGACAAARRVVLTEEVARALGGVGPDAGPGPSRAELAAAWEPRCNDARGALAHPVNCVDQRGAQDYCRFRDRRLPTSAEWSFAVAAGAPRPYPWGDEAPTCGMACFGLNGTCFAHGQEVTSCPVGRHARDRSPFDVLDLAGNVAEWVSDHAPDATPGALPLAVLRGGSFADEAPALGTHGRKEVPAVTAHVTIGFRCAADAPEGPTTAASAAPAHGP
jgi:serine/threonine-protein kinase